MMELLCIAFKIASVFLLIFGVIILIQISLILCKINKILKRFDHLTNVQSWAKNLFQFISSKIKK